MTLPSTADQFRGLPMGDLIGGPLTAACDAQVRLAGATADFIKQVGFLPPTSGSSDPNAVGGVRTVRFQYDRPGQGAVDSKTGAAPMETVQMEVPLLAVVKVPNLGINKVNITFDMEVKSSESSAESDDKSGKMDAMVSAGWGPFSAKVNISGSVSSHKENQRSSDQSAKYHVEVLAEDKGMPEGLARVMDMLVQSVAPKSITPAKSTASTTSP
jgi:hypothetical protein